MAQNPQHRMLSLSRRRFLRGTLGGVTGLTTWQQGWRGLSTVAAQKGAPRQTMPSIWDLGATHTSGPRVAVSGLGLIPLFAWSGPYEDVQLKT